MYIFLPDSFEWGDVSQGEISKKILPKLIFNEKFFPQARIIRFKIPPSYKVLSTFYEGKKNCCMSVGFF
jgi:hypothetical protein